MAPYTMAHLKLDWVLKETGYKPKNPNRFRIFLTNSLEEFRSDTETLFTRWLSQEAAEANSVKHDTPVMVVIGNPPYAVSSSNKGEWIHNLIADYKKDLNERKINLDDDYIKFLRYGEHLIEKNGEGILAFISNNSFIDGITHRQMRKHLLETFDKIYILDLHGSTKKNEAAPDGSKDENVFDIMQGVSINIFVKTSANKKLAEVKHFEVYGLREIKYRILNNNSIESFHWQKLNCKEPYFFFVPKAFEQKEIYNQYIGLDHLFKEYGSGVKNERDKICIQFTEDEIKKVVSDFRILDDNEIYHKYNVRDTRDWKVQNAKKDLIKNNSNKYIRKNLYRIFDARYTYYTGTTRGFIGTPGNKRMKQLIGKNNIALITCRQQSTFDFQHVFISKIIADICVLSSQTKETGYIFPLYLYTETNGQQPFDSAQGDDNNQKPNRVPNLNMEIVQQIADKLGLTFTPEEFRTDLTPDPFPKGRGEDELPPSLWEGGQGGLGSAEFFSPLDILDYIYAVLHSPTYRETYREFLKIDFPRVPYPKDLQTFQKFVKLGGELRTLHLLENPKAEEYITTYPKEGDNIITRKINQKDYEITDNDNQIGRVWINDEQYFDKVPKIAWEFYIGGYQPAQKWLKDRRGRELSFEDILHYQKIIAALNETEHIMKQIG